MSPLVLALSLAPAAAPIAAVDVIDVVPVAVGVVAGPGEPGPCGPRRSVVVLRDDAARFLEDPTAVPTTRRSLPTPPRVDGPARLLPLWSGPGLFAGEAEVFAAAVDAALLKAKVTTLSPTSLVWRDGQPALRVATSADADAVEAALRAFTPTSAWLEATAAAVARARAIAGRAPGTRALEQVDARLCLGGRATTATSVLSPAVVRAALAAPLLPD